MGLDVKTYYTFLLVQQLAMAKSPYSISKNATILQSLIALAHANTDNPDEKREYEQILNRLAELQLQLKELEQQLRELENELEMGNLLTIPPNVVRKYSQLVTELRRIEALVISKLDEILDTQLPLQAVIPSSSTGTNKRKKKMSVEDEIDEFLA